MSDAVAVLRIELRRLRRQRGFTQRDLLTPLHLASHTAIVDYESGRRIPARDIVHAYEVFFALPAGALQALRDRAIAQRAGAEARSSFAATRRLVPRQLPPPPNHFVGRTGDLAALSDLASEPRGAIIVSAIDGMAGVGKTTLAVQWGHQVRDRFPDGDLYVNLRGFHPTAQPLATGEALGLLLTSLGVPAERLPPSVDERAGLFRSLLADRRTLVLLDNAATAEQVRPLLPGAPGCATVITSRNRLAGLVARDGATRILLDVLSPAESLDLLRDTIGADRVERDPDSATALAEYCGRHPLALRVAAERIVSDPSTSFAAMLVELGDRRRRLTALDVPEDEMSAITTVFGWSYSALAAPAARLFALLGLADGADIDVPAAAAMADAPGEGVAETLAALTAAHLISEVTPGRFRFHDLLQIYANDCALATLDPDARQAAVTRLTAWYLHSACAARATLNPHLPPMTPDALDAGITPMSFATAADAMEWFERERANLVAATYLAQRHALNRIAWQLPTAMYGFFDLRKHYPDWVASHEVALTAARTVGDEEAQGRILCNLGNAYRPLRRDVEAIGYYEQALKIFGVVGYRQGEAKVLSNLGCAYEHLHQFDEAGVAHRQALEIFRELDDRYGEALTLTNLGEMYRVSGDHQESAAHHRKALDLFRAIDDLQGAARATSNLGLSVAELGDIPAALELEYQALADFRTAGDIFEEGTVLAELGNLHARRGDLDIATERRKEALAIFEQIGDEYAARRVATALEAVPSPA